MSEFEQDSLALTAADSAAATSSSSSSLAQRCDQDSLSVIFSFCQELRVVVAAALSCRSWRAAAVLRRSSCRAHACLSFYGLLTMLQSPLRIHLARLTMRNAFGQDLLQLSARCSHLEELTVWVDGPSVAALKKSSDAAAAAAFNAHAWPASLRSLLLGVKGYEWNASCGGQRLVDALPCSAPGLQSLLFMSSSSGMMLDLSPLQRLDQFTSLTTRHVLSPPQVAVVKQLPALTDLNVGEGFWTAEDLHALLADDGSPHQLRRLQRLNLRKSTVEADALQCLLTLPSLTELQPDTIMPNCFPLLRSFTRLRALRIAAPLGSCNEAAAAELLSSLRALPDLMIFELSGKGVRTRVLQSLLDGLGTAVPQLHELRIESAYLPPVSGLRTCTGLRSLSLRDCTRESSASGADVLALLQSLSFLERLELRVCRLSLTELHRAQLTPPSFLVPSLKQLIWVM